jgi:lipoate-protein ligase A
VDKGTWRLIITSPAAGAWNMALDEAILESVVYHQALPTLRLYAWDPPCLSLGQAQPSSDVDLEELAAQGWDLVRRPTGGRAILHTDELTYSVAARLDEPRVAGTILESYRRLSGALLRALELLHLQARADQQYPLPEGAQQNGAVCFEVPSNYEITVDGKKLIGSAQARRLGGVLQHGSLPLYGDLTRITRVLAYPDPSARESAASRLNAHAATVETFLGRRPTWEEAAEAFRAAFAEVLDLEWIDSRPLNSELARADELVALKYGRPDWILRV